MSGSTKKSASSPKPEKVSVLQLSNALRARLEKKVIGLGHANPPVLALVDTGGKPTVEDSLWIEDIKQVCKATGIRPRIYKITEPSRDSHSLRECMRSPNKVSDVCSVILQPPLPAWMLDSEAGYAIAPERDVMGMHPANAGFSLLYVPPELLALQLVLRHYDVMDLKDKRVTVAIDKYKYYTGNMVGYLIGLGASVTVSATDCTNRADIAIVDSLTNAPLGSTVINMGLPYRGEIKEEQGEAELSSEITPKVKLYIDDVYHLVHSMIAHNVWAAFEGPNAVV